MFRNLLSFLASRSLPFGVKDVLYSACVCSVTLYESDACLVKDWNWYWNRKE